MKTKIRRLLALPAGTKVAHPSGYTGVIATPPDGFSGLWLTRICGTNGDLLFGEPVPTDSDKWIPDDRTN